MNHRRDLANENDDHFVDNRLGNESGCANKSVGVGSVIDGEGSEIDRADCC
jgi:hypothetical protein